MSAEILNSAAITKGLTTRFMGQNVLYYPVTTSTNDIARQRAQIKAPEGTAVIAGRQTSGRGRLRREWVTPQGNIAVTIVLYPSRKNLPFLTIVAALAVLYSIEKTTGLKCQLKWPNDVLINQKKVCGILLESQAAPDSVDYAIIGIGINVNMKLAEYPEISAIATSLADETGKEISRAVLLQNLFLEMEKLYLRLQAGESIMEEWRDNLVTLGKSIHVRSGDDVFEGIAESVAGDGSLMLRCSDGRLLKFMAGDVTLK
jgi:BirA family transcriptional regulator, biotin operon repressor / biotin---[acetyl-CoA-carboxylase] ligase